MRFLVAALLGLIVSACASDILKSYVGKTVADAIMDYGPPVTAFDVDQRRRAFIWTINSSYTTPGSTTTTGNLNVIGGTGFYSATTISSPPQTFSQQCNYTIFAERIPNAPEGPASWRIVDFKKPNLMCE